MNKTILLFILTCQSLLCIAQNRELNLTTDSTVYPWSFGATALYYILPKGGNTTTLIG